MAEDEFVAEKIVDKRKNVFGKWEYLVKWRGYSHVDNTWESSAALKELSPDAIDQFESSQSRPESVHSAAESVSDTSSASTGRELPSKEQIRPEKTIRPKPKRQSSESQKKSANKPLKKPKLSPAADEPKPAAEETKPVDPKDLRGFDRKLEAERICGITDNGRTGEHMFLIKWKGVNSADLVPARQANLLCPQVVIQFYESNISFK